MSGVTKSASPLAAPNFVIDGDWVVETTNAEAAMELNAKKKDMRSKDIVEDFMVVEMKEALDLL